MPHRCAHQFGLDQDIPFRISPPSTISAGSEGLARCWSSFLRIGTGSRFLMPKTARAATFTAFYCRWFHDLVHQCKSYPPPALVTLTCPARKDPERERSAPARRRAPDFQGFDSLFPPLHATASTTSRPGTFMFHSLFDFKGSFICIGTNTHIVVDLLAFIIIGRPSASVSELRVPPAVFSSDSRS
jgi:hypothetical protein